MTIQLTHEQALLLRACTMLNVFYERRTARRLSWLMDKGLVYSDHSRRGALTMTMMGEAALAAYDAHYTTIETAELERLQQKASQPDTYIARLLNVVHDAVTGDVRDCSQVNESAQCVVDDIVNLRRELDRLRALERKIGTFLGSCTVSKARTNKFYFGNVDLHQDENGQWVIENPASNRPNWYYNNCGNALSKAFELFEVPKEGV